MYCATPTETLFLNKSLHTIQIILHSHHVWNASITFCAQGAHCSTSRSLRTATFMMD